MLDALLGRRAQRTISVLERMQLMSQWRGGGHHQRLEMTHRPALGLYSDIAGVHQHTDSFAYPSAPWLSQVGSTERLTSRTCSVELIALGAVVACWTPRSIDLSDAFGVFQQEGGQPAGIAA